MQGRREGQWQHNAHGGQEEGHRGTTNIGKVGGGQATQFDHAWKAGGRVAPQWSIVDKRYRAGACTKEHGGRKEVSRGWTQTTEGMGRGQGQQADHVEQAGWAVATQPTMQVRQEWQRVHNGPWKAGGKGQHNGPWRA